MYAIVYLRAAQSEYFYGIEIESEHQSKVNQNDNKTAGPLVAQGSNSPFGVKLQCTQTTCHSMHPFARYGHHAHILMNALSHTHTHREWEIQREKIIIKYNVCFWCRT